VIISPSTTVSRDIVPGRDITYLLEKLIYLHYPS